MAEHDEDALGVAGLEGWDGAHPPSGFAERVTSVWMDERRAVATSRPSRRRVATIASVVIAVVVVLGVAFAWRGTIGRTDTGSLRADERAIASIGDRAHVVAEAGAQLRWHVDTDGRARVQQSRGAAFYRVDRGGPFEVMTPHGSVRVTGTCFTVEIEDMERGGYMKAGAAGAVLAAAVVVTVYEGDVVLARDGQEVTLAAGDRGRADERGARRSSSGRTEAADRVDSEASSDALNADELVRQMRSQGAELAELREREAESDAQIRSLRAQIEALGGTPDLDPKLTRARRCAQTDRNTQECSFADPDNDTLVEMARCGTVKVDLPMFLSKPHAPAEFSAEWGASAGLSPAELRALEGLGEKFRNEHVESLQKLYAEAGGSVELAEDQVGSALEGMIEPLLDEGDLEQARRRLAQERAGLVAPADAAGMSLEDRYIRRTLGVGDDFQAAVAAQLGPERARELRLHEGGWPGGRSTYRGDCVDE